MKTPEPLAITVHEDVEFFREALRFTAAHSGFTGRLIEKDYFCTVLLAYLNATAGDDLVFKGGTCLTKVHSELYRLSEDLDYTIPVPFGTSRSERSKRVEGVKAALSQVKQSLPAFRVVEPLRGANNSTQYVAIMAYSSMISRKDETIKIEVSLREPLLMPIVQAQARTLLLDPVSNTPVVSPLSLSNIAKTEAFAEKFRAALSRRDVAIRDFYDVDHAVQKDGLQPKSNELIGQVKRKIAVPGNEPVNVSDRRLGTLRAQLDHQLRPVLREQDFTEFDLERAFEVVVEMAKAVG
jgi:predicted nucleotidyltransferase component of viral defense system